MTLNVIELNDASVRVVRDGTIVCESPGVALVERSGVLVGNAAHERAHLNPRAMNNRFWQQLNEIPLPNATRRCRHNADLAYHHLNALLEQAGRPSEAIIAVPGSFDETQLSLLLGIAAACNLTVSGLVDYAVAAVAGTAAPGRYTVADLHQHHATLTQLVVDTDVRRIGVDSLDQSGVNRIHEACVDLIADAFLEQSRFDPLHEADTEQLLYTHLPAWLDEASRVQELHLAVDYHGNRFSARIPAREFIRVTQMVVGPISEKITHDSQLLMSASLAALPGTRVHLAPTWALPAEACYLGVSEHRLAFGTRPGGVAFTSELPACSQPSIDSATNPARADGTHPAPTHILAGNRARRLSGTPLFMRADGQAVTGADAGAACSARLQDGIANLSVNGADVRLNGQAVSETCRLAPGDQITLEGGRALFVPITVEE